MSALQPANIAMTNGTGYHGARVYYPDGKGAIQELVSNPAADQPANLSNWSKGMNSANYGITGVYNETQIAAVCYGKNTKPSPLHVFFQTTNGDIRTMYLHREKVNWLLDPTVLATVPLGSRIAAFEQSNVEDGSLQALVVIYTDKNGVLKQRTSTTQEGNWSDPIEVLV